MKRPFFLLLLFALSPFLMKAQSNAGNPDNPYDFVGQVHNDCMIEVFPNVRDNKHSSASFPSIEECLNARSEEYFGGHNFHGMLSGQMLEELATAHNTKFSKSYEDMKDRGVISDVLFEAFTELDQMISSAANSKILILDIKEFESRPWANMLNDTDLAILYSATSTARHSANQWTVDLGKVLKGGVLAGWQDVVRADVRGAIIGAWIAFRIARALGLDPITTIRWILSGAAVGGSAASLAEAARQIWDWFW